MDGADGAEGVWVVNEKGCIVDFETVNIGRRPQFIAAISARHPFWVPLYCRIKYLCCLL